MRGRGGRSLHNLSGHSHLALRALQFACWFNAASSIVLSELLFGYSFTYTWTLPIVSIVISFFGVNQFYVTDLKR